MNDDASLLREYARSGSESAFAELVRRHVDLVHSAARRQVAGDTHRAEDVTQAVFAELARQARRLGGHRSLAGWLYTTARFVAARMQRAEQRRIVREQTAHAMNEEPGSAPPDWADLQPLLDDAMHRLSEPDREAVVLRFFQDQPLAAVGNALGVSENAARMRVDRALDRLRRELARRGVVSTAAALASVLGAHAVSPAPAGLASAVAAATQVVPAASAASTASALATLGEAAALFMTTKKWLALAAVVLAGAAVGPRLLPPPSPPAPVFEAQFTEPPPAADQSTTTDPATGFRWAAVEAADYRQFIANLRESGAPERLIRDVVTLELLATYAPRYREAADPTPQRAFWQKEVNRQPSAAEQRRFAGLEDEMAAILHGLLGPDANPNDAFCVLYGQPDWQRVELAWLPPETVSKVVAVLGPNLRQEQAEQKAEETGDDQERRLERRLEALSHLLTPAELKEYRHRNSWSDRNLKAQLRYWDATAEEFHRLAELKDTFIYQPAVRMEDFREREARVEKLFGRERAATFLRATDLTYGYALAYARQAGLPPDSADQIWRIKQSALAEDERLRLHSQLPGDALQRERAALVRKTADAMTGVVGPDGLRYVQQEWPWWQALEKP